MDMGKVHILEMDLRKFLMDIHLAPFDIVLAKDQICDVCIPPHSSKIALNAKFSSSSNN